jgi:hypothetical protein
LSVAIPPFDIGYSTFDILRFAFPWFYGSLFGLAKFHTSAAAGLKSGQFNHQETVPFWCSFIQDVPPEADQVSGRLSLFYY